MEKLSIHGPDETNKCDSVNIMILHQNMKVVNK